MLVFSKKKKKRKKKKEKEKIHLLPPQSSCPKVMRPRAASCNKSIPGTDE